jgi:DNA-binding MarR family transcriptional regulator
MTLADEALERLFRVTVALADAMADDLADRGLTRARATVLARLHRVGPTNQRTLALELRVSPRNITGLVDGLEAAGLVVRAPHPRDRRATLVTITDAGTDAATALADDERALARFLFTDRPAPELARLVDGLDGLLRRLDDPAFATLRRSALDRWPLQPSPQARAPSRGSDGHGEQLKDSVE